jgi:hypothetical protein
MSAVVTILLVAILVIGTCLLSARILRSYLRYRNQMVVTCPETERQVGVDVDARRAAITGSVGKGSLRLTHCTRWPEKQDCGQECLSQIETSPEGCMVKKRLEAWYQGKTCACCDKGIGEIRWHEHKPALVSPDHNLLQWEDVGAEEVTEVLSSHQPVCGTCNFAEKW